MNDSSEHELFSFALGVIKLHGEKMILIEPKVLCCRLTKKNKLRRSMLWLVEWKPFDHFIIGCILLASFQMAIFDYSMENSNYNYVLDVIGWVLAAIFIIESLMKIVAFGFIAGKKTYLRRSGWNIFDAIVVFTSLIDIVYSFGSGNVKTIRLLRMLRVLRPLRSLTTIPSLRQQSEALI